MKTRKTIEGQVQRKAGHPPRKSTNPSRQGISDSGSIVVSAIYAEKQRMAAQSANSASPQRLPRIGPVGASPRRSQSKSNEKGMTRKPWT